MANVKLSQLRNINIEDPDLAYIMCIAPDKTGKLQNYRISISQIAKFVEGGSGGSGTIEGLDAQQVQLLIDAAIKKHEIIDPSQNITVSDKIIIMDNEVSNIQDTVEELEASTENLIIKTAEIKADSNSAKAAASDAVNKVVILDQKVVTFGNTIENNIKPSITENSNKIDSLSTTITEQITPKVDNAVNKVNEFDTQLDNIDTDISTNVKPAINVNTENIEKIFVELETIKEVQNIEAVTYDDAADFFNDIYNI